MKIKKYLLPVVIIAILLLAGFLRLWELNQTPPGIWYDEAYNGLDALKALESNNYQIFYPENYGREGLYINTLALSFKIFGINNFALRFPSAFFGILTILGFYLLLKSLKLSRTTIILGIFALTTSFYHLNFSRITFRAIMVPLLMVWSFHFFIKGFYLIKKNIKSSKRSLFRKLLDSPLLNFFIAGLLTGLGLHTYIAYRVVPLIFVIILIIFLIVYKKFLSQYWKAILIFLMGAIISAGPLLLFFQQNPSAFTGRTDAVSIFNAPNMTVSEAFIKSLLFHLQSFFFTGDGNQRHNHSSLPLLPAVWALFFAIGFFISLKEIIATIIKRFKNMPSTKLFLPSLLGQAIFWTMLIPGVLSLEGIPHALRIIGVIPAIFLITILPFEYLRRLYQHLKASSFYSLKLWRWKIMQITFSILIVTVLLTGIFQSYLYFELWAKNPKTAEAFQQNFYQLGEFIKQQPLKKQNYLLLDKHIEINKENRSDISEKSLLFSAMPIIKEYQIYNVDESIDNLINESSIDCSDSQFILLPNIPLLSLKKIKNYCRNLELQEFSLDNTSTDTKTNASSTKIWILK